MLKENESDVPAEQKVVVHLGREHFCEAVQYFFCKWALALTYLWALFLLAPQRLTDHSQVHPSLMLLVSNTHTSGVDAAAVAVSECVCGL